MSGPSRRLLGAACAVAGRGWPVFPLQPYGKRPAIRGWPQRATTDPDQLAAWWERAPYNIGIACGPAGLLVVDLDRRPAAGETASCGVAGGAELLAVLAVRAGAADPRETYTVTTPSGEHRYFTVPTAGPEDIAVGNDHRQRARAAGRTTAGALGPRIDTRASGGYVAAAGSVRAMCGHRRYYSVARPDPVAPAPPWLLNALIPPATTRAPQAPVTQPTAYARTAIAREATAVRVAEPGTRNSRLFSAAVRLGQLAGAGLLTEQDATAALLQAADPHIGVEGFTTAEAMRAVSNGLGYGRRRPRSVPVVDR